jgi:ABC-type multidrug transport system fused ATPase/permease subunit
MLFAFMGLSFVFGFVALIIFLMINFFIQSKSRAVQKIMLGKKDNRMRITTETFNSLKVLKLYAWEDEFLKRIEKTRDEEVKTYKNLFFFTNFNLMLLWLAPVAVSVASIGAYQYFVDVLKIDDIFTCLTIFNTIQEPIRSLPWTFNGIMETLVSMRRIEKYLHQEEVDPSRILTNDLDTIKRGISVKVERGYFSWGIEIINEDKNKEKVKSKPNIEKEGDSNLKENNKTKVQPINEESALMDSSRVDTARTVLKNINLEVNKGEFICIIGEVGSGKSSLLQAILNNMMPVVPPNIPNEESLNKIILNGGVSYVSQIPWIQNNTVRENILFYSEYDEVKYNTVLDLCELRPDLEVLVGKDMTEIGEKGINLSGGQKARISIARAMYADSDIYMLDDPISALDAHVGQNIMKKCILNYMENKTRILVTHALQYLSYADRIIYMDNGEIVWEGTYQEIIKKPFFEEFALKIRKRSMSESPLHENLQAPTVITEDIKKVREVKRITKDEDKEEGGVKREVYCTYIKYIGGICLFLSVLISMLLWQGLKLSSDLWLSYWTKVTNKTVEEKFHLNKLDYFWIYAGLGLTSCIFVFGRVYLISSGNLKLSKRIHKEMITNLIHAPIK